MDFILTGYHVSDATWFYLSFLLIVAVFFRFTRFWSLRNVDLALLLSIGPALLFAQSHPGAGSVWLFVVTALVLLRVELDSFFTRRPRLPQNMNAAGLTFLCLMAFAFLMTKVITEPPPETTMDQIRRTRDRLHGDEIESSPGSGVAEAGPASELIVAAASAAAKAVTSPDSSATASASDDAAASVSERYAARGLAILAHLAVVTGLIFLAHRHFGDIQIGLAMATLYLLLPCTAYEVGKVNHVLPSALIVWAFVAYRHVLISGCLIGLACGILFFPVFLLPLWVAFYWKRGEVRFGLALSVIAVLLLGSQFILSSGAGALIGQTFGRIEWQLLQFRDVESAGFWSVYPAAYRIPVFVSFLALLVGVTIWPRRKNLEDLMAQSTAIVVATQFWYPQQSAVYVLWYLPLLLMVVFRPPLQNHVPPEIRAFAWFRKQQTPPPPKPEMIASATGTGTLFR